MQRLTLGEVARLTALADRQAASGVHAGSVGRGVDLPGVQSRRSTRLRRMDALPHSVAPVGHLEEERNQETRREWYEQVGAPTPLGA